MDSLWMELTINGALATVALLYHFAGKWETYRKEVSKISFLGYVKEYPANSLKAVAAMVISFAGAWTMGWLNPMTAIASGYMGNSLVNKYAERGVKMAK